MPRSKLATLQGQRLQQQIRRAYERVPFYRESLEKQGIAARDIQSIHDIERLPFTVKDDFRATYPYGLFAVPIKRLYVCRPRAAQRARW